MSTSLSVFLAVFFGLLIFGAPVAWSMLLSALAWIAFTGQWSFLPILPQRLYQGMDLFVLMAVPMFILAGEIISEGRVTDKLVRFANVLFGWMRGGLAQVNIGASILFSGITGVALGDIAALGRVFIPAMTKEGYTSAYAAAVTASSSIIGPMVPPSLIVVLYGSMTQQSIGALFAATIIPGLVIGAVQMALVATQARRLDFPHVAADRSPVAIAKAAGDAALPLLIPIIILGGILGGLMTPTEAGAAAAFYALLITMLLYRTLRPAGLPPIFTRSMLFTGQLFIIVGAGGVFSWVMAFENVPTILSGLLAAADMGPVQTLLAFNLFLLVVGMFIDPSAAIILFAPILAKAATSVGIHPIHFGVVMILNLNIGLLTPPLGVCLFAAEKIADCGFAPLLRATAPFLVVNVVALLIVTFIPGLSLWLPGILGF